MRKNRFEPTPLGFLPRLIGLLPLLAGIVILLLFLKGIQSVNDTTLAKQQESLETALSRSIAQCYAVEGMYPPNLHYLKEHYGLIYDEDMFLVDYRPLGSNLMPETAVLPRQ